MIWELVGGPEEKTWSTMYSRNRCPSVSKAQHLIVRLKTPVPNADGISLFILSNMEVIQLLTVHL